MQMKDISLRWNTQSNIPISYYQTKNKSHAVQIKTTLKGGYLGRPKVIKQF